MADSRVYFSDYFGVSRDVLDDYGAFDINLLSDLPLFVDPFLIFNSEKPEYEALHEGIIDYLRFLKEQSASGRMTPASIKYLYRFQEVRQNWFGYTYLGNGGRGLGVKWANALDMSLGRILLNFGEEGVTRGSHLEKLTLIRPGIGKDSISDFTTNLIKHYLVEYTEAFARTHIDPSLCDTFGVARVRFNYATETWVTEPHYLPRSGDDYVLLTPVDLLTHDDTWINYGDMVERYPQIVSAIDNDSERDRVSRYFESRLGADPTPKDQSRAAVDTLKEYPFLLDLYIALKEESGDEAEAVSKEQLETLKKVFVDNLGTLIGELLAKTDIASVAQGTYADALARVRIFKQYVENQDGWQLLNRDGRASQEKDVQLFFGLALKGSSFDVNREANNGRGPVDFKLSFGDYDKSLIEVKLASNSKLKKNLQNQLDVYEAANETRQSVSMIIVYTEAEAAKVARIVKELGLEEDESVVVVDARSDNKPSGSRA